MILLGPKITFRFIDILAVLVVHAFDLLFGSAYKSTNNVIYALLVGSSIKQLDMDYSLFRLRFLIH